MCLAFSLQTSFRLLYLPVIWHLHGGVPDISHPRALDRGVCLPHCTPIPSLFCPPQGTAPLPCLTHAQEPPQLCALLIRTPNPSASPPGFTSTPAPTSSSHLHSAHFSSFLGTTAIRSSWSPCLCLSPPIAQAPCSSQSGLFTTPTRPRLPPAPRVPPVLVHKL